MSNQQLIICVQSTSLIGSEYYPVVLSLRCVCVVFALCLRCVCVVFALCLRCVCVVFALCLIYVVFDLRCVSVVLSVSLLVSIGLV